MKVKLGPCSWRRQERGVLLRSARGYPAHMSEGMQPSVTFSVALHLNRRLLPFTALNS